MWVKCEYQLESPVILGVSKYQEEGHNAFPLMADGVLAFHSFLLRTGGIPVIPEIYNEDLPFCKTEFGDDFFYNIGSFIFDEPYYSWTAITRKLPAIDIKMLKRINLRDINAKKGHFKSLRIDNVIMIGSKTKTVYFYAEINDDRRKEAVVLLNNIKGIGKKKNSGFGWLTLKGISQIDEKMNNFFIVNGDKRFLYRPVPIDLLRGEDYDHIYMSHLRPPYHKNIYNKKEVVYGFRKNVHEI